MTERPAYMSKATLAAALDISESTVDKWVGRGDIPRPIRSSTGSVRWRWEDVDAALQARKDGVSESAEPFVRVRNARETPPEGRRVAS